MSSRIGFIEKGESLTPDRLREFVDMAQEGSSTPPIPPDDYIFLYLDSADNKIKIRYPDGTIRTLDSIKHPDFITVRDTQFNVGSLNVDGELALI